MIDQVDITDSFQGNLLSPLAAVRNGHLAIKETSSGEQFFIKYGDRERIGKSIEQELEIISQTKSNIFSTENELLSDDSKLAIVSPFKPGNSLANILSNLLATGRHIQTDTATALFGKLLKLSCELNQAGCDEHSIPLLIHSADLNNIWITDEGELRCLGLGDFAQRSKTTSPSQFWSPSLAPEFILGEHTIDERTEVYAAGVVLFRLLTCRPLISATSLDANLVYRLFRSVHPVPSDISAELSAFDEIVATATQWMPERRYQSLQELNTAFETAAGSISDLQPEQLKQLF
jgi:serine/threonine protein kinase